MDILPYIVRLLNDKNQVIVPGLGKFYIARGEGQYKADSETYTPPIKRIAFSTEYIHDDKLVQTISQMENIPLTKAYAALDEYVRDIKTVLKKEKVSLENIGELSLNQQQIQFENITNNDFNIDYFGLPKVEINEVNWKAEERPAQEQYSLAEQAMLASENGFVGEDKRRISPKAIWFGIAALLFFGLISLFILKPEFLKYFKDKFASTTLQVKDEKAKADSIYNAKSLEEKLQDQGFEVEKARDSADIIIQKNEVSKQDGFRYEIIIGLFKTKKEALDKIKLLNDNGIPAKLIEDAGGLLYKISGATLYNQQDASKELARLREELNPEAFPLKIKILNKK